MTISYPCRKQFVPISLAALMARINRKLAREESKLRKNRSPRWDAELADYYMVDMNRNAIVEKHVDPEELGRELSVLRPWEALRAA